ncbi:MAG: methylated-DNA--[protein]-cysteine S-methyltransferase [Actinobacteria bacterium]|nr:methylated-DNA--[protein]-cysteine S-methyltransferase [Actinomycetota bacterium]
MAGGRGHRARRLRAGEDQDHHRRARARARRGHRPDLVTATAPRWWRQPTPIGELLVVAGPRGVCRVELPFDDTGIEPGLDGGPERDDAIAEAFDAWFAGADRELALRPDLTSVESPFRRTVLETLRREVPWGETVTYGELAAMAGAPGAARAVGTAMARNPVPLVVPCHRVVASGGRIGGYGGGAHGVAMKRVLLEREGLQFT